MILRRNLKDSRNGLRVAVNDVSYHLRHLQHQVFFRLNSLTSYFVSASTLLVGWQAGHPTCKNWQSLFVKNFGGPGLTWSDQWKMGRLTKTKSNSNSFFLTIFIAHWHAYACRARYCFRWGRDSYSFFCERYRHYKIPRDTLSVWALNTWGGKNLRFSTEVAVYLGNGTREVHGYYESLGRRR